MGWTNHHVHVQEAELRVDVLQHHAALIGGPNATSCPICHKLFLGSEALMEHMKNIHKDTNASGVPSKCLHSFYIRVQAYSIRVLVFCSYYDNLLC